LENLRDPIQDITVDSTLGSTPDSTVDSTGPRVRDSERIEEEEVKVEVKEGVEEEEEEVEEETMTSGQDMDWKEAKSIYEFTVKDIDGNEVSLEKYKGFVVLIVNVATNCGLTTNNYKQLNEVYDKYRERGLRILAFPCNQFNGQEPGCDADIKEFAKKKKVEYDMFSKIDVNGNSAIPLYKYLKEKQGGFLWMNGIKWNFSKFLVNKQGVPVSRYAPTTAPTSIEKDIEAELTKDASSNL
jgi:glutathione peroxidase-family protein